jgi:hypothetical protein
MREFPQIQNCAGKKFFPLVHDTLPLRCGLKIMFLRKESPGKAQKPARKPDEIDAEQRRKAAEEQPQREQSVEEILEEMGNRHPIILFSINTHSQVTAVQELGNEILSLIKQSKTGDRSLDASKIMHAYNLFWFWVLGVYEVLRTMDQHKKCFTETVAIEINKLKKKLAVVRMPFAKQELRGTGEPISSELSIYGFGSDLETLLFQIQGKSYDAVALIRDVMDFFYGINRQAIINAMPRRRA